MNINEKASEILSANGLDFHIHKVQLGGINPDTNEHVSSPYYGLLNSKSGNIINTVKDGYTVSQNRDVVELVLEGMKPFGDKLSVTKAGSLNDGRKVFLQLAIEGDAVIGTDIVKKFVTIIDSNDGSTGLSVGIGDLTMSCQNQFFKFYERGMMKMRHTDSIRAKIMTLPSLITVALEESLQQIKIYEKFQQTAITKKLADDMVREVLGFDRRISPLELANLSTRSINMMDSLYANIEYELEDKGMNLWGLHSGVTRWTTHDKSAPKRENGRVESIMVGGTNYKVNQDSLNFAMSKLQMS